MSGKDPKICSKCTFKYPDGVQHSCKAAIVEELNKMHNQLQRVDLDNKKLLNDYNMMGNYIAKMEKEMEDSENSIHSRIRFIEKKIDNESFYKHCEEIK